MSKEWLCLLLLGMTACSEVSPFVDSRREAGQVQPVGQSRPNRIAVCYNPIWSNMDTVANLATDACKAQGKTATYQDTSYFNCRLMTPNTAFYSCK